MIKLLKNCEVYAPKYLGRQDILIAGERIMRVSPCISGYGEADGAEIIDMAGARVAPGYIDLHIHITGGGGEQGPSSRVPEIMLSELTLNGVTTALGLLGTDGVTRSQQNLLAKARALCEEGITVYTLTGSYQFPSPTITGDVLTDIITLDKTVGVKIAISDHRSSCPSVEDLVKTAASARVGGMLSGKAGITVMHMGASKKGLAPVFKALEQSDIPIKNFLPTHVCRNDSLTKEASEFTRMGGTADFTADFDNENGTAAVVSRAISEFGALAENITISSDACGSQPKFDAAGNCTGLTYTSPSILHDEIVRFVEKQGCDLSYALQFLTSNPARVLALEGIKGCICEGADADLIVYGEGLQINDVFAKGRLMVKDGVAIVKGRFEK